MFQDGSKHQSTWVSVNLKIVGDSRDWVFVTTSDIEERIKQTKVIPWSYIFLRPWIFPILMIGALAIFMASLTWFNPSTDKKFSELFQTEYTNGKFKDPIEAMIFVMKYNEQKLDDSLKSLRPYMPTAWAVSIFIVLLFIGKLITIMYPAYNFYWGGSASNLDKKKNWRKIFWSGIVFSVSIK